MAAPSNIKVGIFWENFPVRVKNFITIISPEISLKQHMLGAARCPGWINKAAMRHGSLQGKNHEYIFSKSKSAKGDNSNKINNFFFNFHR